MLILRCWSLHLRLGHEALARQFVDRLSMNARPAGDSADGQAFQNQVLQHDNFLQFEHAIRAFWGKKFRMEIGSEYLNRYSTGVLPATE